MIENVSNVSRSELVQVGKDMEEAKCGINKSLRGVFFP